MSKTTNYDFDKQKWGHQIREDDLNRIAANLDLIDAAITESVTVWAGTSNFAGNGGAIITHNHNLSSYTPIIVQADTDPIGSVGEIWVTDVAANSFVVRNSGSALTPFTWVAIKKKFEYVQLDVDMGAYANYPGSAVEMPNGSVWMFYTQGDHTYHAWNGDGKIKYRVSNDGGVTWSSSHLFYDTPNRLDIAPLPYREGNTVYFYWTQAAGPLGTECNLWMRKTINSGTTWTDKVKIWGDGGANEKINNVVNLIKHGSTYIFGISYRYSVSPDEYRCYCIRATDIEGTWTKGADVSVQVSRGAMEPSIVELSNGDIYMSMRTKSGYCYKAVSSDDTATWDTIAKTSIASPEAKATVLRLSNGHLLMVWNNVSSTTQSPRYPLTVGISTDDFATFDVVKNIKNEGGNNQLSNMGNPYELSDGTILFGYGHGYSATGHIHLDVARFTESELA